MVIIGMDLSLASSAISIFKNNELNLYNYTNKSKTFKWIKNSENFINYRFHKYNNSDDYSDAEITKIISYDEITDKIINDVKQNIGDEETNVYMEGYAYGGNGKIIDIVTYTTLLRSKLVKIPNIKLHFLPPSSLKSFLGQQVYMGIMEGKKMVYRDENGKASGSFDKKDMMNALLKLNFNYDYLNYIKINKEQLLSTKDIPKPFDDFNDSITLLYYGCTENNINF